MNFDSRQQAPFFQFLRLSGSGVNEKQTVAITGTPTGGTFTVTRPAGGGLPAETSGNIEWDSTAAQAKTVLDAMTQIDTVTVTGGPLPGVNEVQTLTITGTPTGGDFTITFDGQETAAIAWNANAAAVDSALDALSNITDGDVTVTGGALPGTPIVITFTALLGAQDVALMVADGSGLTGGSTPAATIALTTPGSNDPLVIEFTGTSGLQDQPLLTTSDSLTGGSTPATTVTLTTRGIAADEHNMAIDGSSSDQLFGLRPTSADVFIVSEVVITVEDTGAMTPALFGFLTQLIKGVKLQVLDAASAVTYDLFDGEPIKANKDLPKFFADVEVISWGSGNEIIVGTFDLSRSGSPLAIDGAASETLVATVQDDLTGLVDMTMRVKGYRKV